MIVMGRQIFPGEMVDRDAFIPVSRVSQISALTLAAVTGYLGYDFNFTIGQGIAAISAALLAGWAIQRHYSRSARGGFFLDKPRVIRKPKATVNFNQPLTDHFQKLPGFENCMVTQKRAPQHDIYIIPNLNPKKVRDEMTKISMLLNVNDKEMHFNQNWSAGHSAIYVPTAKSQWTNVKFDASELDPDKLQIFFGRSVKGDALIVDLEDDPFGLAAGITGGGKTNLVRNSLKSLPLSNINTTICIMDPKEDAQLKRESCDWYSADISACVSKLETLYEEGEKRQAKYSAANCDNFFEYQRKVDPAEEGIFVLAAELADFFEQDLTEQLEKDEHPLHKRARSIINRFIRKRRSSGIFLLCDIQDPKKDVIGGARDQFGYRISLVVTDSVASKVALGFTGAERLPPKGGMLFRTTEQKTPVLGRAAII